MVPTKASPIEGNYNSQTFEANSIYMVHPNLRLLQGVACITISCSTVWKQNLYMLSLLHFQISSFPKKKKKKGKFNKASSMEDNYKFSKASHYLDQDSVKQNQFMVPNKSFNSKASPTKLQLQSFTYKSFAHNSFTYKSFTHKSFTHHKKLHLQKLHP